MEKKTLVNLSAVIITAVISAIILYETLVVGSVLKEAGLVGVFLTSLFSHLTVIGRDMFIPSFLPLTIIYHPLLLGLSAGLGGAIGEVTTYYWGIGIKEALEKDDNNSVLTKWIEKYGLIAIFFVAVSPLPDTPIVLLAGSNRFPLWKLMITEVSGKILLYSFGAMTGGLFFAHLNTFVEELALSVIIVVASVAICLLASWSKSREKVLQLLRRIFH